jgi:DNA-binding CsgD family transcriptional regulator
MVGESEEREIEEAARWHARVNGFTDRVARVLAYKHAGFVNAWIARHLDTTENTVKRDLQAVEAVYGARAVLIHEPGFQEDFNPVSAERIADWPEHFQEAWLEAGREHPTKVPRELRDRFEANRR